MARITYRATLGQSFGNGRFGSSASSGASISTTAATDANTTTLAAINAMGALSGYSALTGAAAALAAAQAASAAELVAEQALLTASNADVTVSVNTAVVTTKNALSAVLKCILRLVDGSDTFL